MHAPCPDTAGLSLPNGLDERHPESLRAVSEVRAGGAAPEVALVRVSPAVQGSRADLNRFVAGAARLHTQTITGGFLTKLGLHFLRQVYHGIAEDEFSRLWVALSGGECLGFLAYAVDVPALFRRVLRRRRLRMCLAALPAALRPGVLVELVDTMRYPAKQAAARLPQAEILSVGVSSQSRGGGVGRRLVALAIEQARADGQSQLKVLAGAKLNEANRFYQACGFRKHCELMQHGESLNVYVIEIPPPG